MDASPAVSDPAPHPAIAAYARHVNPAFVRLLGVFGYGRVFTRAHDVWIWDYRERRYLDLLAGFGSMNLGHNHPRLAARMHRFLDEQMPNLSHTAPSIPAAELAQTLAKCLPAPLDAVLFSNSGAEAVEAALKLARAATGREGLLYCSDAFHGTSLGTLSVTDHKRMRPPFEPLLPGCHAVPFGDLEKLESALRVHRCAAFLVEPIQAEGGVHLPPSGYLQGALELCRRHGALLMLDEVQTGIGRCGHFLACEAEGVVPDVVIMGKALGGGLAPISATITTAELRKRAYGSMERHDLHGSTFAGNAFSCVAALETLQVLRDEALVERSAARGKRMLEGLRARLTGHPLVREIRGRGLLIGLDLGPTGTGAWSRIAAPLTEAVSEHVFGQWVALRLLERGFLCQPAAHCWGCLKIEPPLVIGEAEVDEAIEGLVAVLEEYRSLTPVLVDAARRMGRQFTKGWAFP